MAYRSLHPLVQRLLRRVAPECDGPSDGQLLQRFVNHQDTVAFQAIVWRHAPMVWDTCRRILHDWHAAEDAFQASFLVLVRKASSIRSGQSVGGWLFRVAYRVALKAQARRAAQPPSEDVLDLPAPEPPNDGFGRDLRPLLDEALDRLPEKYRTLLVLHYLEGQTVAQIAREIGCPPGTVTGRLDRAKHLLRRRLVRQGVTLSAAALASALVHESATAAPDSLRAITIQVVTLCATSGHAGAIIAAPVSDLVEGALRAMHMTKIRQVAALVLSLSILAAGTSWVAQQLSAAKEPPGLQAAEPTAPAPRAQARRDLFGDPLPPGALARIGTLRFRHGGGNVACAPDGKTLLSAGSHARLWDAATGQVLRQFEGNQASIGQVVLSPDGKVVVGQDDEHTIWLWAVATGQLLGRLQGPPNAIATPAFSPDGKLLATGGHAGIIVWDVATRKEVFRKKLTPLALNGGGFIDRSVIMSVAFAPDGKMLAAARGGNGVLLFDVATWQEVRRLDEDNDECVNFLAFSPDGKLLAAASGKAIDLWDAATGRKTCQFAWPDHAKLVTFSPDGKLLVGSGSTSPDDGSDAIVLWDVAVRKQLRRLEGRKGVVSSVAFAPDGKTVVAGAEEAIRRWDVATGQEIQRAVGPVIDFSIAMAPDGKTLATAEGRVGTLRLWHTATGRELHRLGGEADTAWSVAFSPDGKTLASGGLGKWIQLWDPATGKEIRRLATPKAFITFVAFASDGKVLISKSYFEQEIRLWHVGTGQEIRQIQPPLGGKGRVEAVAFAPERMMLALACPGAIYLLDVTTGKPLCSCQGPDADGTSWMEFSSDGRTLVARNYNRSANKFGVTLWETATGKPIRRLDEHSGGDGSVAFAPDGRTLVLVDNGAIQFQDLVTGMSTDRIPLPHGQVSGGVVVAPDGTTLITRTEMAAALVWDIRCLTRVRPPRRLTDQDRQKCWAALAGDDAGTAYDALGRLADAAEQAVPYVREHLRPAAEPDAQRMAQWIADLDSPEFDVRQKASDALAQIGPGAKAALRQALAGKPSPEARQRLEQLLERTAAHTPDSLQAVRAIQALEWMGTSEAQQLLQRLARGPGWPERTREEAHAALARLAKRRAAP